jgi:hypothetical protein
MRNADEQHAAAKLERITSALQDVAKWAVALSAVNDQAVAAVSDLVACAYNKSVFEGYEEYFCGHEGAYDFKRIEEMLARRVLMVYSVPELQEAYAAALSRMYVQLANARHCFEVYAETEQAIRDAIDDQRAAFGAIQ